MSDSRDYTTSGDGMPLRPALRPELDAIPIEDDGEQAVLLHDPSGISDAVVRLRPEAWAVLMVLDGRRTVDDAISLLARTCNADIPREAVVDLVETLDRLCFLTGERAVAREAELEHEWNALDERPPAHAGASYPDDPDALRRFLDDILASDTTALPGGIPAGIIVPHIDLRIGPETYAPAIRALARCDVDTVVILGTAHYASDDQFFLTSKHYRTPLGVLPTDRELLARLRAEGADVFTVRDVAHRREHSIEFPVLFLQRVFDGRPVRILPVLCGSQDAHLSAGTMPRDDERYRRFITAMKASINGLGRRVAYVLSIDWSHVGRKFGDAADASELLDAVRASDTAQLRALENADIDGFTRLLRATSNATRIDGFSCIHVFFDLVHPASAILLRYDQWHEVERASAVTFASMTLHTDSSAARSVPSS